MSHFQNLMLLWSWCCHPRYIIIYFIFLEHSSQWCSLSLYSRSVHGCLSVENCGDRSCRIDIGYFLFERRRTWWPNLKSIWYLFLFLRVIVQNVKLDTTCSGRHVTASAGAHWHCNIGILATGGRDSWSLLLLPSRLPEILMGSSNASSNLENKSPLSHFPQTDLLDYMY